MIQSRPVSQGTNSPVTLYSYIHSSTLEFRPPLLSEGSQGLIPIFCSHNPFVHLILYLGPRPMHRLQSSSNRCRCTLTDITRQRNGRTQDFILGPRQQLLLVLPVLRHHLDQTIRDAHKVRLGGRDAAPGKHHIARAAHPDQGRQSKGPSRAWDDAQARLRQGNLRRRREDAEVCAESELKTAAQGERRHGRDGRDGQGREGLEGIPQVLEERAGPFLAGVKPARSFKSAPAQKQLSTSLARISARTGPCSFAPSTVLARSFSSPFTSYWPATLVMLLRSSRSSCREIAFRADGRLRFRMRMRPLPGAGTSCTFSSGAAEGVE
ncbi:hypothetical protein PVAG01_03174 [Phlyctema vagabunda]|uniref:Uncharacterized protein n=1 Tax=Phlyctema vagabunda TaxID=108571 RepID=A0ABR4PT63_9HELO